MVPLIYIVPSTALLLLLGAVSWLLLRRFAGLRRRLAVAEASSQALRVRLDEVNALFESRLLRLEGVKGAAGSRSRRRRQAAELIRQGDDPSATARRCGLQSAELSLLLQLDQLRTNRSQGAHS